MLDRFAASGTAVLGLEAQLLAQHLLAQHLLAREARLIDDKLWEQWAAMLTEDVEYWVPSWLNEYDLVTDPNRELSLIYHVSQSQLLERIAPIESRKSITALPLPRTLHMIANVDVTASAPDSLHVRSCWDTHIYDPRTFKQWLNFAPTNTSSARSKAIGSSETRRSS
jgi:3-phenylpropionate/cinnamic acid dioxygenase small subunit